MLKPLNTKMTTGLTVCLMLVLSACGQNMKSSAPGSEKTSAASSGNSSTEEIAGVIAKAQRANDEANGAIVAAKSALATIQDDDGNINVGMFKSSSQVQTKGVLSPIIEKLRGPLDMLITKATLVKQKFAEARQLLMMALAKLDDKDPTQAAMINEIMKQMAAIDKMEATFRTSMLQVGGKLDSAVDALEKVISGATSFIPGWGWVVNLGLDFLVMGDIRDFVAEIKIKLIAL